MINIEQKRFPKELKESVARRYLSTDASFRQLAEEVGSSTWSVRAWVREYQAGGTVGKRKHKKARMGTTEARSAEQKLRLVIQAKGVSAQDRGEFLRREGVHDADLERWERDALAGLQGATSPAQQVRVQELERKVRKQEKRLKEADALLTLQKKVQALWAAEDDDTTET